MTTTFDITNDALPSFASLQEARVQVFSSRHSHESLEDLLGNLPSDGELGRRKGLGMWILGRFEEALGDDADGVLLFDNVAYAKPAVSGDGQFFSFITKTAF